jgi:hypothetical protein
MLWLVGYSIGGFLTIYLCWRFLPSATGEPLTVGMAFGIWLIWWVIVPVCALSWVASLRFPEPPRPQRKSLPPEVEAARCEVNSWLRP